MEALNDGGSAFPHKQVHGDPESWWAEYVPGMSLRDWFAGQAVHGLMIDRPLECPFSDVAAQAYEVADAMIAERERGK